MFKGVFTALITPFKNGNVDEKTFESLIERQIAGGIHGLVPCGTTGESPTLTHEEHNRAIELCIQVTAGRVPVIAGTGSNSTAEAIQMAKHAEKKGADGVLVVTPYYNKPTQEGLYQHYKAINDAIGIPVILYNIPGRSVIDLSDDTIARLAALKNIKGIKDATGNLERPSRLRALVGPDFLQFSGDDAIALAFNAQGGAGCISVTSNIVPDLCAKLQNLWTAGNYTEALVLHDRLMTLHSVMFCESNPTPVKYALSVMGLCEADVRLPLVQPMDANKARIREAVAKMRLLHRH
jgi:4-hydroxy-tetrahydrodipicolinate synthase